MKILMLHGYTQSGFIFRRKTWPLAQSISAAFPGAVFHYPDGPIHLDPMDQPRNHVMLDTAFSKPVAAIDGNDMIPSDDYIIEAHAWCAVNTHNDPPKGYRESLQLVADILRVDGPFDGVIAFSQGTLLAGFVISLLEGNVRKAAFERARTLFPSALCFPECFQQLQHPPMKFGVFYGPMMARGDRYAGFYTNPAIATPICHVIGRYDPVVDLEMSQLVLDTIKSPNGPRLLQHPGAHHVPTDRGSLRDVVNFIKESSCSTLVGTPLSSSPSSDLPTPLSSLPSSTISQATVSDMNSTRRVRIRRKRRSARIPKMSVLRLGRTGGDQVHAEAMQLLSRFIAETVHRDFG